MAFNYHQKRSNKDGYMTISGLKAGETKVTLSFVSEQGEKFYKNSFQVVVKENAIYYDDATVSLMAGANVTGYYCFTGEEIASIACDIENPEVCSVYLFEPTWSNKDGYMTISGLKAGETKVTLSFVNEQGEKFYQNNFQVVVKGKRHPF